MKDFQITTRDGAFVDRHSLNLLLVRERNVDGCGSFADVLVLLESHLTKAQRKALVAEFKKLRKELDCPDTDAVVQKGLHTVLGVTAQWIGYELIEY